MDKRLGEISDLAVQGYQLYEVLEELELPHSLEDDAEVLDFFNAGLIHIFIQQKSDGVLDGHITSNTQITQEQCTEWGIVYGESIRIRRLEISTDDLEHAQSISSTLDAGVKNVFSQTKSYATQGKTEALKNSISSMVEKMKAGDTTDILTLLTTNIVQTQHFNGRVTEQMQKDMSYKQWELLSKMQMKLLQESRKTAMAINEICNPKRTTFVKNATQNILNSEKNKDIPNELPAPEEEAIDAETYSSTTERV